MADMKKYESLTSTESGNSPLEQAIRKLQVQVCTAFISSSGAIAPASFISDERTITTDDLGRVTQLFPSTSAAHGNKLLTASKINQNPPKGKRVGVIFSGGPAAGGHNVIVGLKKVLGENNTLLGINSGPKGLLAGDMKEITVDDIKRIYNTGGFDFLGSDRTKIKTPEQFDKVKKICRDNRINALVIIGGDDSNTNAAFLAEKLFKDVHPDGSGVQVIGIPKTIDGDLQIGAELPISFGFDTATRIYAELVGNILQDTPSSKKYWHFIKLMGRAASHVALEVALQTKPAIALISEEVATKKMDLHEVINGIAKIIIERSKKGMNYGVALVPEGLIEFIPGVNELIAELNALISLAMNSSEEYRSYALDKKQEEKRDYIYSQLSEKNKILMKSLPEYIQDMLLADRDAHGNLQVSLIPTEKLIIDMVTQKIKETDPKVPFQTQDHFFGYEGRCGTPSKFDMSYTLNLGMTAGSLILDGRTGYIASMTNIDRGGLPLALPLTGLLTMEKRGTSEEFVIEKALVDIESEAFKYFATRRNEWAAGNKFSSPGPRQFWGPVADYIPKTVYLNKVEGDNRKFNFGKELDLFQN